MPTGLDSNEFQEELQRLDAMLHEAEADPAARGRLHEIVQAVLHLHSVGLERMLEIVSDSGEGGDKLLAICAADDVVSGMLLLHGLHPFDVEERIRNALERVRPLLRSHGGNVEFVDLLEGTLRVRLVGSCHSCPSSTVTMRQTVEETILALVPEVMSVELDEPESAEPVEAGFRVALPLVGAT